MHSAVSGDERAVLLGRIGNVYKKDATADGRLNSRWGDKDADALNIGQ